MGSAPSVIIDPVRVPRIKGRYPPPLAPKWFLPDIRPLVNTPEVEDLNSRGINWDALERSLDEDEEDGVDATKDTIRIRPSSGVGSVRTDSGLKKVRQAKRHGLKHVLSFEATDKHAKLSAIKAKLIELGAYVDDELPDYIMVMVANKKSQKQMTADLSLFLGTNTEKFSIWLHGLLKKLQSINTDEPGSKHKAKEKHKVEKKKHKAHQGEKEKAAKASEPERQRKSSTGEKERPEKKKIEDKTETSTVNQDVEDVEQVHNDAIEISENTGEFIDPINLTSLN